jgi:hypothetical protein
VEGQTHQVQLDPLEVVKLVGRAELVVQAQEVVEVVDIVVVVEVVEIVMAVVLMEVVEVVDLPSTIFPTSLPLLRQQQVETLVMVQLF